MCVGGSSSSKGECGDDVDPMPFLVPSEKERLDAMNKPYDIKHSSWVKDEREAFIAREIQSEDGDKVTVKTTKNTSYFFFKIWETFYVYQAKASLIIIIMVMK